ncbi:RNA polymerase factor sigma-54 [Haloimpatiens sp. FM7330]|uniref:RNA polymerase factor sigma-54 n=1 Tax=Haloimpatiens sp. FM7330 TaxID=3298610 RepID=UPI00364511AD
MKLDFNLKLTQEQRLVMTQQMQLSVKMLQMSGFELQEYIGKEVEENPVLDAEYDTNSNLKEKNNEIDYKKFIEYLNFDNYSGKNYYRNEEETVSPFTFISNKKSLKDYLNEQIIEVNEGEYTKEICKYIVENLDNRGYLDNTVENICEEIEAKKDDVEYALKVVQSLEPDGIACGDLKECLKIQLNKKGIKDENLFGLIDDCLELLANNKLGEISKKLKIKKSEVQRYVDFIRTLEPKPARGFYTGENVKYIAPDAYIRKIDGEYHIIMNDDILPKLKISPLYKNIVSSENNDNDNDTADYVKKKINNAMFLIKSIQHRKSTIYRVLEQIIDLQRDYFDYGKEYLKPMTLKEISYRIDMHESTVSRAIRDKYIYTNKGIVKIKDLFTVGISSQAYGDDISTIKIKNKIKECIESEDKKKPLSDQKICDILKKEDMNISRRTVAKYREELGIKSSSKRKRF